MGKILDTSLNAIVIGGGLTVLNLGVVTVALTVGDLSTVTNAALSVPDVASLKSLPTSSLQVGTLRQPLNYRGSDGTPLPPFELVAKSGATEDNFLYYDTSDNAGLIWKAKFSGPLCLNWAGLYGDDTTDDEPRSVEAWDRGRELGFEEMFFLPRKYHFANMAIFTTLVNGQAGYEENLNFQLSAAGAEFDNTIVKGNSEGVSFAHIRVKGAPIGFHYVRAQHCHDESLSTVDCPIGFFCAQLPGHKANSQVTRAVYTNLQAVNCSNAAFLVEGSATANKSWFNNNYLQLIATGGNFVFRYIPQTSTDSVTYPDPVNARSRCNYNSFRIQAERDNTNLSAWIEEGVGNLFDTCHFDAENGAGQVVVITGQGNVFSGGRLAGLASLPDLPSFASINSEDGGWVGRALGFQVIETDRLQAKDEFINNQGLSTFPESAITLVAAADQLTNHTITVALPTLPNQKHAIVTIRGWGRLDFASPVTGQQFNILAQVSVLSDENGAFYTEPNPIALGANFANVTCEIAASTRVRLKFDTTVNIASLSARAEYAINDRSEL